MLEVKFRSPHSIGRRSGRCAQAAKDPTLKKIGTLVAIIDSVAYLPGNRNYAYSKQKKKGAKRCGAQILVFRAI